MNDQAGCCPRHSDLLPSKGATEGRTEEKGAEKKSNFAAVSGFAQAMGAI